ncbi:MAG TPA: 3-oxoacyl-[acyl-carrier-protein] synthase III C-terminal domain-containing protein [Candidatus Dormibacteraeota bacterium]
MTSAPVSRRAPAQPRTGLAGVAGIGVYRPPASAADSERLTGADCHGVSYRVRAESGLNTASLAAGAARAALKASGIDPQQIGLIVAGTTTPDVLWPTTACLVQTELGLPMVASFDLYAAQASLLTAFDVAAHYMKSGTSAALVIGAEASNQLVDFPGQSGGRHARGASAVVLAAGERGGEILATAAGGRATREGGQAALNELTLSGLAEAVAGCLRRAGLGLREVDLVVAEQTAPELMRRWLTESGVPASSFVLEPERYAESFAAAPFAVLHDAVKDGRLKEGQVVLMLSCGAGPVWAVACLRWGSGGVSEW